MPRQAAPAQTDTAAAAPSGAGGDEYRVRAGDTLSRIAGRTQRQGVSLDQMLVSLYRGNPQAFVENNMNRLKAGVVLSVPSADTAKAVTPTEAREVIPRPGERAGADRGRHGPAGRLPSDGAAGRELPNHDGHVGTRPTA